MCKNCSHTCPGGVCNQMDCNCYCWKYNVFDEVSPPTDFNDKVQDCPNPKE